MPADKTFEFSSEPAITDRERDIQEAANRRWELSRKKWWLALALFGTICFSFGSSLNPATSTRTIVVHTAPTIITVPPTAAPAPTVTVTTNVIPASCKAALKDLTQLQTETKAIINVSDPAITALQDAYVAVAGKDIKGINKAADTLHSLSNSIADPSLNYQNLLRDSDTSTKSCLQEIDR